MISKKLDMFKANVMAEALEKKQQLEKEMEQKTEFALKEAEEKAFKRADRLLKAAKQAAERENNLRVSKAVAEQKKLLLTERAKIADEVFFSLESDINNYRQTTDYAAWLEKCALITAKKAGSGAVLYFDLKDKELAEKIAGKTGCEIKTADITGGVYAVNELAGIICDNSFKSGIKELKETFLEKAGLTID